MSNKHMKRKKPINLDFIKEIEPLTDNQKAYFDAYQKDQNIVGYGCAGTGKTFVALYNALTDVLSENKIMFLSNLIYFRLNFF